MYVARFGLVAKQSWSQITPTSAAEQAQSCAVGPYLVCSKFPSCKACHQQRRRATSCIYNLIKIVNFSSFPDGGRKRLCE